MKAICDSKESFSFDTLNYMLSDEVNLNSFLEFMQKRISKRKVAQGTKDGYNIALIALRKFKKINLFCDLTLPNIKAFDDFMKEELEISQTTVYLYHTVIKIFVKEAFNMGLISKNPYNEFKYSKGKSHKRKYLRDEEKDAFINTVPKDDYEKISKDLFIFCCYTGLSFSDLKKFNWEKDVYKTSNGSYYIDDCRNKTDINYKIVLLTPAMEILKEYNFKLPKIDYYMYRSKLRRIGERAGIKERVTPHVARHTFATWTLSQKIRLETVSKMLAHKNIATTQIYAKILQEEVFEAYDLLESKLSK